MKTSLDKLVADNVRLIDSAAENLPLKEMLSLKKDKEWYTISIIVTKMFEAEGVIPKDKMSEAITLVSGMFGMNQHERKNKEIYKGNNPKQHD